jgi:hypothetical protein
VVASWEHLLRRISVWQLSPKDRKHNFLQAVRLWKQTIRYESASNGLATFVLGTPWPWQALDDSFEVVLSRTVEPLWDAIKMCLSDA